MQSEAAEQYCATVEELVAADQSIAGSDASSSAKYQEIVVTDEGGARTIVLNRPHKYNAITLQVCCSDHCIDHSTTFRWGRN